MSVYYDREGTFFPQRAGRITAGTNSFKGRGREVGEFRGCGEWPQELGWVFSSQRPLTISRFIQPPCLLISHFFYSYVPGKL